MTRFERWWRGNRPKWWRGAAPVEPPKAEPKQHAPIRISPRLLGMLQGEGAKVAAPYQSPWEPRQYAPGVLPDKAEKLAMDADVNAGLSWAGGFHGMWAEGIGFLGYPYLAELTQRPEYRRPCEILAEEMTRKWIRLRSTGDDDKAEKIRELDGDMVKFNLREKFHDAILLDNVFGLSFLYVDVGTSDKAEEQATPLTLTPEKIPKGCLKGFQLIDPTWTAPNWYEASRPWLPNFYKPDTWFLMGRVTHKSRLLITVSRPVPDILKPGYNFGGISLTQMLKPYVDNWLKVRQGVTDIVLAFTTFVLETNMSDAFSGAGGDQFLARAQAFGLMKNNLGLLTIDKETEGFQTASAPLSNLDMLQAQAQEHMASVWGGTLLKAYGLSPSGLNADTDAGIRVFYDMIHARQQRTMGDNLATALKILQLNRYGEIDPEIEIEYVPLWQLDEAGEAAVQKMKADTAAVEIESGVISPEEERERIANDPESPWHGLQGPPPEPPETGETPDLSDPSERIANRGAEGSETGANSGDAAFDAAFNEADHPRGQPENAGQFAEAAGGGGKSASPSLSKPQKDALQHYTSAGSYPINDFLRNGTHVEHGKYANATNLRKQDDLEEVIGDLDSVFAHVASDKEMTVYRGVNNDVWATIKKMAKEHGEVGDAGFLSTTTDKKTVTASSLTHWLTITVPKGYAALPLDGVVPNRTKSEVLLRRGTKFRVVKITANNAVLEVIP